MKNYEVEKLREDYTIKSKGDSPLEKAKKLDQKAKLPAYIFAYTFGVIGALVLGLGMCLAMKVIGEGSFAFVAGIIIGLIGIAMVSINYPIFNKILRARKEKYASAILVELNRMED